jgi:dipeptidyl-peptidase-4
VRTLVDNSALRARLATLRHGPSKFFKVTVCGNTSVDGWMMLPQGFDSTKKYPVLFEVYGEPAGSTVGDAWGGGGYLWDLLLTQRGYIVMSVDNRGTATPRGRAWRKIVYGEVGVTAVADQAVATRTIGRMSFVDSTRLGVWGWSGGGSTTLGLLFTAPDVYRMGMAVAPVSDKRYYDTIYQERYMGLPATNVDGYRRASALPFAKNLKADLLIVHGSGDDNVHFQGTELLINKLVALGKPFDFMDYPNRNHSISEGEGTSFHVYSLIARYLEDPVPPGAS